MQDATYGYYVFATSYVTKGDFREPEIQSLLAQK